MFLPDSKLIQVDCHCQFSVEVKEIASTDWFDPKQVHGSFLHTGYCSSQQPWESLRCGECARASRPEARFRKPSWRHWSWKHQVFPGVGGSWQFVSLPLTIPPLVQRLHRLQRLAWRRVGGGSGCGLAGFVPQLVGVLFLERFCEDEEHGWVRSPYSLVILRQRMASANIVWNAEWACFWNFTRLLNNKMS